MSQPTKASVHVNTPLTNISIAYMQGTDQYVADKVFPVVPVDHASDSFYVWDLGEFTRDEAKDRAPGTESAGGEFKLSTDSYNCKVKAFHKDLAWQTVANADKQLNLETAATNYVTQKMLIAKEKQFIASFMVTSVWGESIAGVASGETVGTSIRKWSDYTNSNPITDVSTYATRIASKTGFRPNKLVMARDVYDALKNHPDILDRINGGATTGQPAIVIKQLIAALFEVDEILVMDAIVNTAKEGQTASYSFLGAGTMLLVYAAPSPSQMMPSGGYTFSWDGYVQGAENGIAISQFEIPERKSDRIEGEIAYDQKVTGAPLGVFFSAVI